MRNKKFDEKKKYYKKRFQSMKIQNIKNILDTIYDLKILKQKVTNTTIAKHNNTIGIYYQVKNSTLKHNGLIKTKKIGREKIIDLTKKGEKFRGLLKN